VLKLIYHGRFLHGSVSLGALSLPLARTTVMHLVARENLPEPNSSGTQPACPRHVYNHTPTHCRQHEEVQVGLLQLLYNLVIPTHINLIICIRPHLTVDMSGRD
jgi:hypothetical protein